MSRFVYYTIHDQYVRIQNELHILRNMHEIKRDLRSLRTRAFEFPVMPVPYGKTFNFTSPSTTN